MWGLNLAMMHLHTTTQHYMYIYIQFWAQHTSGASTHVHKNKYDSS